MGWRLSQRIALAILFSSNVTAAAAQSAPKCDPGETFIGEDADYIYCSKLTCAQLEGQIARDQEALKRQRDSILAANGELQEWAKKNQEAADKARDTATNFLINSTIGAFAQMGEGKLKQVEQEFRRREAKFGQTWNMKIRSIQEMESRRARLQGAVTGLKLANYPGMNVVNWWDEVKKWAATTGNEADAIAALMGALESDPEARMIVKEHGLSFISDGLKVALKATAGNVLSFGEFIVNYGYEATAWTMSRARIEQNVLNQERNRIAVCRLGVQIENTVRNRNICHGKLPAKNSTPPDPARCK